MEGEEGPVQWEKEMLLEVMEEMEAAPASEVWEVMGRIWGRGSGTAPKG